jgi:hypothetical protein
LAIRAAGAVRAFRPLPPYGNMTGNLAMLARASSNFQCGQIKTEKR